MNPCVSNLSYARSRANDLHAELGSWDAVAEALRPFLALSGASWWNVSKGERITRRHINALRVQANLVPLPAELLIEACPTCNGPHGLEQIPDCRGLPVGAVVNISPTEYVTRKRPAPAPRTLSDYPTALLKRLIEKRQPMQGKP
jgi:hypothetical protein